MAPFALGMYYPVFYLSRPKSSGRSKIVASVLAFLLIGLHGLLADEFGGGLVKLFFYLPLGVVIVNAVRGETGQ